MAVAADVIIRSINKKLIIIIIINMIRMKNKIINLKISMNIIINSIFSWHKN